MPDEKARIPICASTMWVIKTPPGRLLRMLADGSVVVDGRNGRIGLRMEFNPRPLPPDAHEPEEQD